MTRTPTMLLGAGLLSAGIAMPLTASAGSEDEVIAFVAGAAVGYVIGDRLDHDARHARRDHRYVAPGQGYRHPAWHKRPHVGDYRWKPGHRWKPPHHWKADQRWKRDHHRGDRHKWKREHHKHERDYHRRHRGRH